MTEIPPPGDELDVTDTDEGHADTIDPADVVDPDEFPAADEDD